MILAAACMGAPLFAADDPRVEFALGVHERARGNHLPAAEHFRRAHAAAPDALPLVRLAAADLLDQGDRAGAVRIYQDLASSRPDDLSAQLAYVDFIAELDRDDAAVRQLSLACLEAALVKHPSHLPIIRRLVPLRMAKQESAAALRLLDMLPGDDPEAASYFVSEFRRIRGTEDPAALAVIDRRFSQAMDAHPENAALAREVSDHYRNTKRPDQALAVLRQHTAAAPWSLEMRVRLGVLLLASGNDAEGEALLKEVLSIHPGRAMAHQALAKFYRNRNRPGEAAVHARELLKIRGGDASEFIRLADELLAAGDPREARLLLEKAVFQQPGHQRLAMKLAIATSRDPETRARAPRLFREAEAADPGHPIDDPDYLTESAGAMIAAGQSQAAEERLRAAIRAYPPGAKKETAAALRRLATLWTSENRNAEAARALIQRAESLEK